MADLLPCPMCGCAATFVKHSAGMPGTRGFDRWDAVACKHCRTTVGACDRRFRCREDAAAAWNRRTPDLEQARQEATRQAMQLAENACARIESSEWEQYKGRAANQVAEKAANPYIAGKSDGASDCIDAIRALTPNESGNGDGKHG